MRNRLILIAGMIICIAAGMVRGSWAEEDVFYQDVYASAYGPGFARGDLDKSVEIESNPVKQLQDAYVQKFMKTLEKIYELHDVADDDPRKEVFNEAFYNGWKAGYTDAYKGIKKKVTMVE